MLLRRPLSPVPSRVTAGAPPVWPDRWRPLWGHGRPLIKIAWWSHHHLPCPGSGSGLHVRSFLENRKPCLGQNITQPAPDFCSAAHIGFGNCVFKFQKKYMQGLKRQTSHKGLKVKEKCQIQYQPLSLHRGFPAPSPLEGGLCSAH